MKKIILLAVAVLGFTVAASAQPRAIGLRLGNGGEVSYQHSVGKDFIQLDGGLGINLYNKGEGLGLFAGATAVYNFMIAQPQWTDRGEWGFYAGPGAGVGLGINPAQFNLSAAGMVGLEYTFWFPLQLSIDFRQHIGFQFGGTGLYYPSSIALGVRYRF